MTLPARTEEVLALYDEGLTQQQIADRLGMGRRAVQYRIEVSRVERRQAPPRPLAEVARLAREGKTNTEIAEILGVHRGLVGQWKHEARRKGLLERYAPKGGYTTAQSEIRRKLRAQLGSMAMILNGMTEKQMRWLLRLVPENGTLADVIRGMVIDVYHEEAGNGR